MSSVAKLVAALVYFVPFTLAGDANAGFISGTDLQRQCGDRHGVGFHFCTGYVLGVYDGFEHVLGALGISSQTAVGREAQLCLPGDFTSREVVTAVVKYLNAEPGSLDLPAAVLTESALREAFPCLP